MKKKSLNFKSLFEPKTIAVVGASGKKENAATRFISNLKYFGYQGKVIPIHPEEKQILGLETYSSLSKIPYKVDYAFIAVKPEIVHEIIRSGKENVRFAQIMTSGFENLEDGESIKSKILETAKSGLTRVLGPNCIGTFSNRGKITFTKIKKTVLGSVSIISQSGGLAIDVLRRGSIEGIKYNSIVSIGNSIDIGVNELLRYYLDDINTKVIGIYIESIHDGRTFYKLLRNRKTLKPIIILKGGRSLAGSRAAASHTGSLSNDYRSWDALSKQTGATLVNDLDEFISTLLIFQNYRPLLTLGKNSALLFGNGGGASVIAADQCEEMGLDLSMVESEAIEKKYLKEDLKAISLVNPIDVPANILQKSSGDIMIKIISNILSFQEFSNIIIHLNMSVFYGYNDNLMLGNLYKSIKNLNNKYFKKNRILIVLRSDRSPEVEEIKKDFQRKLINDGITVLSETKNAALGIASIVDFEKFVLRKNSCK
jgi:acyl-CoA synthetase (NDP forming)